MTCEACGAELPAFVRSQAFTDPKTGAAEFHTLEIATWFANQDGRLDDIAAWHMEAQGPRRGLVSGYTYRTGQLGYDGKGRFCSAECETDAALQPAASAITAQGASQRGEQLDKPAGSIPEIARPPAFGKVIPSFITGRRFQQIRRELELSTDDFGKALGYGGDKEDREAIIRRLESGGRPIPTARGYLAFMMEWFGVPRRET